MSRPSRTSLNTQCHLLVFPVTSHFKNNKEHDQPHLHSLHTSTADCRLYNTAAPRPLSQRCSISLGRSLCPPAITTSQPSPLHVSKLRRRAVLLNLALKYHCQTHRIILARPWSISSKTCYSKHSIIIVNWSAGLVKRSP